MPDNQPGSCRLFSNCPSLSNLFQRNKSPEVIKYLTSSQKNCGSRANGRDPILCCTDYNQQQDQSQAPQPAQQPEQISSPGSCNSPDGEPGNCIGKIDEIGF